MSSHPVRFGYFPAPVAADAGALVRRVLLADDLGLDVVGVQDHPYQRRFLDAWTLIAFLAARTQRLTFFPDVASLPLRPPAVLAKSAASLDVLTGGRVELGLGAGAFWDAIEAYGGVRRTPGEAYAATREAIDVIRHVWGTEEHPRFDGDHYRLAGARPGPAPAHDIGIWLGAVGPRMLALVGERADGWVPSSSWAPPERLDELNSRIDDAATGSGRDPARLRRVYNVNGTITTGASDGFLRGPVDQWVDELSALHREQRMDTFVLWPDGDDDAQLHLFAEVADAVRDSVGEGP